MEKILLNDISYWVILFLSFLIGFVLIIDENYEDNSKGATLWRIVFFLLIPLLCMIISRYFIFENSIWNIILSIFILISQIIFVIGIKTELLHENYRLIVIASSSLIFISQISFITYETFLNKESLEQNVISSSDIEMSFRNIKSNFNKLETSISNDIKNIDDILTHISIEINEKSSELENMKLREAELLLAIERYKEISQVSKSEANAIIATLQKDKFKDYIIGFVIGLFSSFVVAIIVPKLKFTSEKK